MADSSVGAHVLVMIPTFNEAANIASMLNEIRSAAPEVDVLVIDDGSPDGTCDIAEAAAAQLGNIHVLRRTSKSGLGNAYKAGFSWGLLHHYDVLCEMDCDFSHDPRDLPHLIQAVANGTAKVAIGSRYMFGGSTPNWSRWRRMISVFGNRYANAWLRLHVSDATSGFRAYSADFVRLLDLQEVRADSYAFQIEMTYLACLHGLPIHEIPIRFVERRAGTSKMSWRTVVEALILIPVLALKGPHQRPHTQIAESSLATS